MAAKLKWLTAIEVCCGLGSFDFVAVSLLRNCSCAQDDKNEGRQEYQLPSLLARFQLISSPMVELVLETGCL